MDQLLLLNAAGNAQASMDKDVALQNKNFAKLVSAIQSADFAQQYFNKRLIVEAFGEPIFTRLEKKDNRDVEFALYRKATEYFNSERVYFYFDPGGALLSWQHINPNKKFSVPSK